MEKCKYVSHPLSLTRTLQAKEASGEALKKAPKDDGTATTATSKDDNDNIPALTTEQAKRQAALDALNQQEIVVTYEAKRGALHAHTRDINVSGVTVTFHGKPLVEDTDIVINYGNRYGLIGPNGSGKSTLLKAIAARAIPIPDAIDIFYLDGEYPATETPALTAVLDVQDEVQILEQRAEMLNEEMADASENLQASIQHELEGIYAKLDDMDVHTAEARASEILFGLGFTPKMQQMKTREFSGGWRMRIALARALFL